ncbi:helix-turn-helix domain-containing protein [Dyadobacter sp. 676]|uniref:Helix-turn-helix domain-containing protein n=1 Tax=Dyadobacter sp. 676 TaxID=3088362 RepID=A0AAU8FGM2_9BACT
MNPKENTTQIQAQIRALQDTIYVIGGKWKLPIIHSICKGNRRFSDIQHSIPGITKRMLSRSLKELEDNKLVVRKVDPDFTATIEYEFTQYALEYGNLILEMIRWGQNHQKVITGKAIPMTKR